MFIEIYIKSVEFLETFNVYRFDIIHLITAPI